MGTVQQIIVSVFGLIFAIKAGELCRDDWHRPFEAGYDWPAVGREEWWEEWPSGYGSTIMFCEPFPWLALRSEPLGWCLSGRSHSSLQKKVIGAATASVIALSVSKRRANETLKNKFCELIICYSPSSFILVTAGGLSSA